MKEKYRPQGGPTGGPVNLQIPMIPKSLIRAAEEMLAKPAEYVYGTPDGTVAVRFDQLSDSDIEDIVAKFPKGEAVEQEKMLRLMLNMIRGLAENRHKLATEFVKVGRMMVPIYKQTGVVQPE